MKNKDPRYHIDLDTATKESVYYSLTMFSYPSGAGLHTGHALVFTANDVIARRKRMQSFQVINPIGRDSFGLPTENYAIKEGKPAYQVTQECIENFRKQCEMCNRSFDRDREIATSNPDYYKRTQRIFQELYKKGLVYRKEAIVNWCPQCQTVLANDQVINGKCERCETEIIQKKQPQRFIKITAYADRLLEDLETLDRPEETKATQRNRIGKSEGAEIDFALESNPSTKITVFTTRPDTLFGVSAIMLAPENDAYDEFLPESHKAKVFEYRKETSHKTAVERLKNQENKTGEFSGYYVTNPINGEKLPVRYADYVLMDYGTGAVMSVPAHDERDWEFAKKNNLEIKQVIAQHYISGNPPVAGKETVKRDNILCILFDEKKENVLCLDWKTLDWKSFVMGGIDGQDLAIAGEREITEETGYDDIEYLEQIPGEIHAEYFAAHKDINRYSIEKCCVYRLRSNHNTGHREDADLHDMHWIPVKELSAYLSKVPGTNSNLIFWNRYNSENKAYGGEGKLINSGDFDSSSTKLDNIDAKQKIIEHLENLGVGKRKTTFKLRDRSVSRQRYRGSPIPFYYDENNEPQLIPQDELPVVLPLDLGNYKPMGKSPLADHPTFPHYKHKNGKTYLRECDTLDTFMCSSFYFLRFLDPKNENELIRKERSDKAMPVDFYSGGREHSTGHLIYSRFINKFLFDCGYVPTSEPFKKLIHQGFILGPDGRKMSKRFGNVVKPEDVIQKYNSDTLKVYVLFMGPLETEKARDENGVKGVKRFLERTEKIIDFLKEEANEKVEKLLHKTIAGITEDIEKLKFNTAISKLMIFINTVYEEKTISKEQLEKVSKLLSPLAPQTAQALREALGNTSKVEFEARPTFDSELLVDDIVVYAVQINGKMKGTIESAPTSTQVDILGQLQNDEKLAKHIPQDIKKVIFIPSKIINIIG